MLPSRHITNLKELPTSRSFLTVFVRNGRRNCQGKQAAKEMSEEQPSYKVTDRRLFNPDGTPREVPEDERPEPKPETPVAISTSASVAAEPAAAPETASAQATASVSTQPAEAGGEVSAESGAEAELPGADDPASFASFMMSIASNAASSLGMMEHPVTRKREVDLELGKHWIDVL